VKTVEQEKKGFLEFLVQVIPFLACMLSMVLTYDIVMYLIGRGFTFILSPESESVLIQYFCHLLDQVKFIFS